MSDTGEINKQVYEKVIQNIKTGRCPHTENVSRKYIRETKIHALHIAAALDKVVTNVSRIANQDYYKGRIYGLYPYDVAVLKSSCRFLLQYDKEVKEDYEDGAQFTCFPYYLKYAYRPHKRKYNVTFESMNKLELCIKGRKRQLLTLLLDPAIGHCNINKGFELIFEDERLLDMQADLLAYIIQFRGYRKESKLERCVVSAIVYENDCLLKTALRLLKTCKYAGDFHGLFPYMCDVLGKNRPYAGILVLQVLIRTNRSLL